MSDSKKILTPQRLTLLLSIAIALLPACSDDGSANGGNGANGDTSYILAGTRTTPDGVRVMFVSAQPSLAAGNIELDTALEIPGGKRAWAYKDALYVFNDERLSVQKIKVIDGSPRQVDEVSMQGTGVASFGNGAAFASDDKAYYFDLPNSQVIIWNPSAMELVETKRLNGVTREGFPGTDTDRPRFIDGNIYLSLAWNNYIDIALYPFGGAMVFSPETDEVIAVAEAPNCANTQDTMVTDAGDFYVVCDPYNAMFQRFGDPDYVDSCLVRIKRGELEFDPDFRLDLRTVTGGRLAGLATPGSDDTFYTLALHEDRLSAEVNDDVFNVMLEDAWHLWRGSLNGGAGEMVEGLDYISGYHFEFPIGEESYVSQPASDLSSTALFSLEDQTAEKLLTFPGLLWMVDRLEAS